MSVIKLQNLATMGNELALAWADGSESYLTFEKLRKACPCAGCQGEPDVTGFVVVPQVRHNDRSFQLKRHEIVGGYALQFFWGDGHSTGIYSYQFLRKLGA
ncbi:MAG: DUF971 family protein [Paracoccaceae bacterium]|jgi:DUF971 family protein